MNRKRILIIITIIVSAIFNIKSVNAYTCTYNRDQVSNGYKSIIPKGAQIELTIADDGSTSSLKLKNTTQTINTVSSITNWKTNLDHSFSYGSTKYTRKFSMYASNSFKPKNKQCPKGILIENIDFNGNKVSYAIASDSTTDLDAHTTNYNTALNQADYKAEYNWATFKITKSNKSGNNSSTTLTNDTCNSNVGIATEGFKTSNYKYICKYRKKADSEASLYIYVGDNGKGLVKDLKVKFSSVYDESVCKDGIMPVLNNKEFALENHNAYSCSFTIGTGVYNFSLINKMDFSSISKCPKYITVKEENSNHIQLITGNLLQIDSYEYKISSTGDGVTHYLVEQQSATTCKTMTSEDQMPVFPDADVTCKTLINADLQEQINKVLNYIRIIIPILIIVLGLIDFGKAMLSSKEDEMKKAQSTFLKRLLIGIAIFLLPTFINLLIDIANTAWGNGLFGNSNCGLK